VRFFDFARASLLASTLASLVACSDDPDPASSQTGAGSGAGGSGGAGGGSPACAGARPTAASDWCARVRGGPAGTGGPAVELSAAHALVRFFGVSARYRDADEALVAALEPPASATEPDLAGYAASAPGALCAPPVEAGALAAAEVELVGGVGWVRPGSGAVAYPEGTQAVVVDLRHLPDVPDLAAALEAAVAPALAAPIPRAMQRVRQHQGMIDEVFNAQNVYSSDPIDLEQPALAASGAAELPMVLLTDATLAPAAAELAATLRLANRASIFGEDLRVEVAEARWAPVGAAGVSVRWRDLRDDAGRWPDVIAADVREGEPSCLIGSPSNIPAAPQPVLRGAAERQALGDVDPFGDGDRSEDTLGNARAALVTSHAAARRFYGYPEAADDLDARLIETLAYVDSVQPLQRVHVRDALRRFGHALNDGHNFVYDGTTAAGYLLVTIEDIDGEPVVRRSATAGLDPGDTIVAVGGVPIATWYQTELARTSAASEGYRYDLATRYFTRMAGPLELDVRAPDGTLQTLTVDPQPLAALQAFGGAPSLRAAGPLGDLGAPTLYYINLAGDVLTSIADFKASLAAAVGSTGLVIDMRGYPGTEHYEIARRLIPEAFSSPLFGVTTHDGPDLTSFESSAYDWAPLSNPSFAGPIVLLVGHRSVSAAENFSTMLVDADRVTVVGRNSAATNGNITGVLLPGGFAFTFTGMEVLHADGNPFHGIGIVPDVEVPLTAEAFAAGADPELLAAIEVLSP
jgi:hypothetical protein